MKSSLLLCLIPALALAQGNVVLNGTVISGNGSSPTGYTAATTLDGNLLTAFTITTPTGNGAWVGIDAGQPVTVVSVSMAPRPGDGGTVYATLWPGCVIEAATDSAFATAVVLFTVPSASTGLPGFYAGVMQSVALSPSQAYRYYRFRDPAAHGGVAEIRFIVQAVSGLTAMPVPPVITPGGGTFLTGTVTVSMTTATSGASIFYTTNGTAPTCGSIAYTGPVALSAGNPPTQVQAVACNSGLTTPQSEVARQYYRNYGWNAGDQMRDDSGNKVQATAGGIIWAEGKWWWVGMNQSWPGSAANWAPTHPGLWMYSSPDLYSWTKVGQIVPSLSYLNTERAHILYNAANNNYVMWVDCGPTSMSPGTSTFAAVLTAPHPYGPWTVVNSAYSPGGPSYGFKDNNLFQDTNGTAYVVFVDGTQTWVAIMQLSSDYTTAIGTPVKALTSGGREGPALFKRGSTYFLITSAATNATLTNDDMEYQTATSPLGTWSGLSGSGTLYTQTVTSTVYNAQATQVVRLPGLTDAYLYIADTWNSSLVTTPAGATWFTFDNTTPLFLPLNFPTSTSVKAPTLADAPSPFNLTHWNYSGMFPMPGAMAR